MSQSVDRKGLEWLKVCLWGATAAAASSISVLSVLRPEPVVPVPVIFPGDGRVERTSTKPLVPLTSVPCMW